MHRRALLLLLLALALVGLGLLGWRSMAGLGEGSATEAELPRTAAGELQGELPPPPGTGETATARQPVPPQPVVPSHRIRLHDGDGPAAGVLVRVLRDNPIRDPRPAFQSTSDHEGWIHIPLALFAKASEKTQVLFGLRGSYSQRHQLSDLRGLSRLRLHDIRAIQVSFEPHLDPIEAALVRVHHRPTGPGRKPSGWPLTEPIPGALLANHLQPDASTGITTYVLPQRIKDRHCQVLVPLGFSTTLELRSTGSASSDLDLPFEADDLTTQGEDCVFRIRRSPQVRVRLVAGEGEPRRVLLVRLLALTRSGPRSISQQKPSKGQAVLRAVAGRIRLVAEGLGVHGSTELSFPAGRNPAPIEAQIVIGRRPDWRIRILRPDGEAIAGKLDEIRLLALTPRGPQPIPDTRGIRGPLGVLDRNSHEFLLRGTTTLPLEVLGLHRGTGKIGRVRITADRLKYQLRLESGELAELPGLRAQLQLLVPSEGSQACFLRRQIRSAAGRIHWLDVHSWVLKAGARLPHVPWMPRAPGALYQLVHPRRGKLIEGALLAHR